MLARIASCVQKRCKSNYVKDFATINVVTLSDCYRLQDRQIFNLGLCLKFLRAVGQMPHEERRLGYMATF